MKALMGKVLTAVILVLQPFKSTSFQIKRLKPTLLSVQSGGAKKLHYWIDMSRRAYQSQRLSEQTPLIEALTSSALRSSTSDDENNILNKNVDVQLREEGEGGASVPNLSISLVKSIVGSGVLALPAGLAGLGASPANVVPLAILLIVAIGAMNAYFFSLIGRVCADTSTRSYASAWDESVGRYRQVVAGAVTFKTVLSCLAFSMILADAGQSIAVGAGLDEITRGQALLGITVVALLPLSLMRDLSSLAPFSAVGVAGVVLTALVMMYRAVDGSYATGGEFLATVPAHLQPAFANLSGEGVASSTNWLQALVLACTLATAFVAHYNAPRFYAELARPTIPRYNTVVAIAFGISALAFVSVAMAGYLTFGTACDGFILNNYSAYDPLVGASRIALAVSIIMTFPLPFVGLRDGTLDLLKIPVQDRTDFVLNGLTVALLTLITSLAYLLHDLALVVAIGGGTFSTLVSSVFPALMFAASTRRKADEEGNINVDNWEVNLALALMVVAAGIGTTGVVLALQKAVV